MYRVSDTVRSSHSQDGAVVLDIRKGQMFNLNPVGSRIFQLVRQGLTDSAMADEIGQEFQVSRDTAEQDVREFMNALKKLGLVQVLGANSQP